MKFIRLLSFHLALTFRPIVLPASKLLAFMFVFLSLAMLLSDDFNSVALLLKIMTVVFGMVFTAIYWFYDYLVLTLKPEKLDLVLFK